ncbi:MAG: hypothetical protein QHH30_05395 [candidate division NC10 bacterium]|nr:hypothetical protein [candidate division NC10 bacterium]
MVAVGDAVAGEKVKGRTVFYQVNWHQIEVGDQEGHGYALYESKGIETDVRGKPYFDGCVVRKVGSLDINLKSGTGYGHGFDVITDKDHDKAFDTWEGKPEEKGYGKHAGLCRSNGKTAGNPREKDLDHARAGSRPVR